VSELLKKISAKPDLIDETPAADLVAVQAALAEQALAIAEGVTESTDPAADIAALEEANALADRIDARLTALAAEEADRSEKVSALASRFQPAAEATDEVVDDVDVTEDVVEEVADPELVAVTAAAAPTPRAPLGLIARRVPSERRPAAQPNGLVASAAGHDGERVDTPTRLGELMIEEWQRMGGIRLAQPTPTTVASFSTQGMHRYNIQDGLSVEDSGRVFDALRKDMQYGGMDALTAAGGVCAPAQPIYSFFSVSTEDGLLQLPTVGAPRGRVTYPVSPSFDDIATTAGWRNAVGKIPYTNQNAIDGASKNIYSPVCPEITTCTIDAYPLILEFGNFTNLFYPEFVAHVTGESVKAHSHFVNENLIADIVAAATVVGGGDPGGGTLVNVSQILSFEALRYREKYRMSRTAVLDVVAPHWLFDAMLADHIARNATTEYAARANVSRIFDEMNVRVQFVYDWQGASDGLFGAYPATVDLLLWAPGTVVRLDGGSLNLGVVRDSTLNSTNEFQTFTETFEAICVPGNEVVLINNVTVCPDGTAASLGTITCAVGS
jgi:hypothetical protein